MLEQEFIEALEKVQLSDAAQKRIIAVCASNELSRAPRRPNLRLAIVAAAIVMLFGSMMLPRLLFAPGSILLPGSIYTPNRFTITAYAMSSEKEQSAILGQKAVEFSFQTGIEGISEKSLHNCYGKFHGWYGGKQEIIAGVKTVNNLQLSYHQHNIDKAISP
jgi:hypothetical protein